MIEQLKVSPRRSKRLQILNGFLQWILSVNVLLIIVYKLLCICFLNKVAMYVDCLRSVWLFNFNEHLMQI